MRDPVVFCARDIFQTQNTINVTLQYGEVDLQMVDWLNLRSGIFTVPVAGNYSTLIIITTIIFIKIIFNRAASLIFFRFSVFCSIFPKNPARFLLECFALGVRYCMHAGSLRSNYVPQFHNLRFEII